MKAVPESSQSWKDTSTNRERGNCAAVKTVPERLSAAVSDLDADCPVKSPTISRLWHSASSVSNITLCV